MRRTIRYQLNVFTIVCLLISLLPAFGGSAYASSSGNSSVTDAVYAVSPDGSNKLKIDYVNFNVNKPTQKSNYVALYTSGAATNYGYQNHEVIDHAGKVLVKYGNTAIVVNAKGEMIRAIGNVPAWENDQYVSIPEGGFILVSHGSNHRFLLYDFRNYASVALERGGQKLTPADFLAVPKQPSLQVTTTSGITVTSSTYNVQGNVLNYTSGTGLLVKVGDATAAIQADGSFSQPVALAAGSNNVVIKLLKNTDVLQEVSLILSYQPVSGDLIEIEAPPEDITIIVEGPKKNINYIDKDVTGISNIIALFTTEFGSKIQVSNFNVAIQVDSTGKVTKMINAPTSSGTPPWIGGELEIPQGGYVVMAQDDSYNTYNIKKYLATKFKVGDIVKLRKNGNVVPVTDLMSGLGEIPRMQLNGLTMYTTAETKAIISGKLTNPQGASVKVGGQQVAVQGDTTFSHEVSLVAGPNYVDVVLSKGNAQVDKKSVIIFSRPSLPPEKQMILWVDQAANARKFQSSQTVLDFLLKAKEAGITDIAFDVKGVEGFVSYKKNDLTKRPYVSNMTANDRKGSNPELDLLELFIGHSHSLGLKVHAAFNVFAEGSIALKDFAIIDQHLDWEERVYRSDDNGQIKRLRESAYGQRGLAGASNGAVVLFVNPSNDEVRDYQLKTFEEVLKNYNVDGIILDRGRYDNETADFSDVTRSKFEAFLQKRGKQLVNWPTDIFRYEGNQRINGPLIQDWWEFRSGTIESFVKETRQLVDRYSASKGKKIQTSAYVGAWFESYYLNGVHWGSKNFRYDSRLNFPNPSIYTDGYYQTGYIDHMDFLMVGTYYSTVQEIQRYITMDSIVTNGEVPLYAGMALADLQAPQLQREIFRTATGSSNGLMLFDASLANWPVVKASIRDEEYVKDYQIGMSKPGNPDTFIEGSYYNVSRNLGDLNVYNEEYGLSTGGNRFGVEVVVDAAGKVTKMVNKSQAMNWSWGSPQDNNSAIPTGGMVISALDENGVRTKRQLIANTYNIGDEVRAAALSGYMNYDGKTVTKGSAVIGGKVKVLGAGSIVDVRLNGVSATIAPNGDFTGTVSLLEGSNKVTFTVYIDGMKTNEKTIQIMYSPAALQSLAISGLKASMSVGETAQTVVEAVYADASRINVSAKASIQSSNPSIASVGENGLVRAVGAGQTLITVAYGGLNQTFALTVSEPIDNQGTPSALPPTNQPLPTDTGVMIRATAVQAADENGKKAMKVTLDEAALDKALALLRQQGSSSKEMIVEVSAAEPVAMLTIPVRALANAADTVGRAALTVKTGGVSYTLPADLIDIDKIAREMGVQQRDLQLTVTLEKKTGAEAKAIADAVKDQGGEVIGDAYDFRIAIHSGNKSQSLDQFGKRYTERAISLPKLVKGNATAVVFDPKTGELTFVPARFEQANGSTTVIIKRTGNSVYTVISYSKAFDDTRGHWAQADIGLLASKLLVKGVTDSEFAPDKPITRAQFATLLVRALGLAQQAGARFGDVHSSDWYASAIATASAAGLIEGYEDGTFRPNQAISREELAVLASRALDFAEWKSASSSSAKLMTFSDAKSISDWAQQSASRVISEGIMNGVASSVFAPSQESSRAQAVVMLKRLIVKLGLIDE